MHSLDITLKNPEQNLACDEVLLDWCEEGSASEILRLWEPHDSFVVLGYSNSAKAEVNLTACHNHNIPILRRCSGGGTVLQGPGCLNYTLIFNIPNAGPLSTIRGTTRYCLNKHKQAIQALVHNTIQHQGLSDLTLDNRKFSGNSQRRKRRCVLFHGTFLYNFNIAEAEMLLSHPSREPDYRHSRSHTEFLTNIELKAPILKAAIKEAWNATDSNLSLPYERIEEKVRTNYSLKHWNLNP